MRTIACLLIFCIFILPSYAQQKKTPSFEDVISLLSAENPVISPDVQHVVYQVRTTDWKNNRFDTELWLVRAGAEPFQLTNDADNSSTSLAWSPDSKWIAFLSKRSENTQIQVIRAAGGEAFQLSRTEDDIIDFEWSPDGSQILFSQSEDKNEEKEKKKEKYASFEVEDQEFNNNHLWIIDFKPQTFTRSQLPGDSVEQQARLLLEDTDFHVRDFAWSPDGKKIAIEHSPTSRLLDFFKADISVLDIASNELNSLVTNPSGDAFICWSPDRVKKGLTSC